ncbi:hypothetical protein [Synechococcus sp. LA31]|nr:hypothetical protein [Synechococcus sp. LA31]
MTQHSPSYSDALVLRGHLTPWLPDWWELIRWSRAKKIVATWGQG